MDEEVDIGSFTSRVWGIDWIIRSRVWYGVLVGLGLKSIMKIKDFSCWLIFEFRYMMVIREFERVVWHVVGVMVVLRSALQLYISTAN